MFFRTRDWVSSYLIEATTSTDKPTWNILPSEGQDPAISRGKMLGKLEKNSPAFPRRGKGRFWTGPRSCEPPRYPKSTAALVQGLNCAQTSQYCSCLQNQGLEPGGMFQGIQTSSCFSFISEGRVHLSRHWTATSAYVTCNGMFFPIFS